MYKSPRTLLAMAIAVMASTVFALPVSATSPGNPDAEVILRSRTEGKTLHLHLANLLEEDTRILLADMRGRRYYEQGIRKHNGYNTDLHMGQLAPGRYLLRIVQQDEELTQVVLVRENDILLSQINLK